ncbi:MAG TPA: DUF1800 family protein [Vicinamibacterales bacterium]|nr:DUF1800 family protein [Vicinamibacterales bacterium]
MIRPFTARSIGLLGLIFVATVSGSPPLDAAADLAGSYELVALHSGKCLDVSGQSTDDGAPVVQWTCNGGLSQRWTLQPTDDGNVVLIAGHSGKALDVRGASLKDGAHVIQYTINGGANQEWLPQPVGDGYYTLTAHHSGEVLDVSAESMDDGGIVIQWPLHGGANQEWLLRAVVGGRPSSADVTRFLEQATWGPTPALVQHVQDVGFARFLDEQFDAPASSYPTLPLFPTTRDQTACPDNSTCVRDNYTMYPVQNRFFVNALYGDDQLRQRVAFALHQIVVVSGVDVTQPSWMSPYLQTLDRNAFASYRQLLYDITINPAMGNYLDVVNNTKTRPNENYAREILQLFSIGTVRLNPDGTPQLDQAGQPIPTYDQTTVNNFARVFTGWRFASGAPGIPNYIDPMVVNETQHDTGSKTLLNGVVLPAGQNTVKDLSDAIDNIVNDPNVGPFISKLLIQHLVTSNPTPDYVARVASVFNDAGGARGDLRAVVRAILLDPEARGDVKDDANYGRLRHPAQYIANVLRAFGAGSADGTSTSDGYLNPQSVLMGMDLFRPPSVFSYFSPGTVVPGTTGVRGPEFGLFSTSTALRRVNFVNTMAFSRIAVSANSPNGTSIDLSGMEALAGDPAQLVDALNVLLMHGAMSNDMRQSVIAAVGAVPAGTAHKRAQTAVYLVATSPQYQVER